jgi:hypothetical protein
VTSAIMSKNETKFKEILSSTIKRSKDDIVFMIRCGKNKRDFILKTLDCSPCGTESKDHIFSDVYKTRYMNKDIYIVHDQNMSSNIFSIMPIKTNELRYKLIKIKNNYL